MNKLIDIKNMSKSFKDLVVLDNLDLIIEKSTINIIKGESGSGKTTLLNILGFIDEMTSGDYYFDGKKVLKDDFAKFRNKNIGFVFQNYNLINGLCVLDNIKLPYLYSNHVTPNYDDYLNELTRFLKIDKLLDNDVSNLSGGEKQRVAICRALSLKPKLILADEPTGNLDLHNKKIIVELFEKINKNFGLTIVIVSHDDVFDCIADNIFEIKMGKIYEKDRTL